MADVVRDIAHAHDVAVVIEDHIQIAKATGWTVCTLTTGAKQVRYARRRRW